MDFTHFLQILLLAIVQGAAELLPVSSSAHVTVVAKLIDFQSNSVFEWTFLLLMLHTGTMFSVIVYFRSRWQRLFAEQWPALLIATGCTAAVGLPLKYGIERILNANSTSGEEQELEHLFQNLPLMACSLAAVGILIFVAGQKDERWPAMSRTIGRWRAAVIGAVQGLALPFRGFSRSGSTISAAMLSGVSRLAAEEFSFALALILTPPLIAREVLKLIKTHGPTNSDGVAQAGLAELFFPGLVGMGLSFVAGLVALRWLSKWLGEGRWKYFGIYCVVAAGVVLWIHFAQR